MEVSITKVLLVVVVLILTRSLLFPQKRTNAPRIGSMWWTPSIITRINSVKRIRAWLTEAYLQNRSSVLLPTLMGGYRVIVAKRELVDELRQAKDLSLHAASGKSLQWIYTFGPAILNNPIQVGIIKTHLNNKCLESIFPDIKEELEVSLAEEMKQVGSEWHPVKFVDMFMRIIAQTSNRIFVGLPLCRDANWRDLQISYTVSVVIDAFFINAFPEFVWPFVGRYLTRCPAAVKRATQLLTPLIRERLDLKPEDRPNDYLTWVLAEAPKHPGELEPEAVTRRLLLVNFAAIHTSTYTAAQAMLDLALLSKAHVAELREEVATVVKRYGWSKASVAMMVKLDSFLRESQRLNPISTVALDRMATEDYTFSDGTFVPKGMIISAPLYAIHTDPSIYPEPLTFNPFRFSSLPDAERHHMVSTSLDFLPYGCGKSACPGRFFLALELKTLFAILLMEYDVRTKEGKRPKVNDFDISSVPDSEEQVLIKRR